MAFFSNNFLMLTLFLLATIHLIGPHVTFSFIQDLLPVQPINTFFLQYFKYLHCNFKWNLKTGVSIKTDERAATHFK